MILFFSGTGNSRFVAEKISQNTGDVLVDLNDKIKKKDYHLDCQEEDYIVLAVPTYAWRIPKIVTDWISHTKFPSKIKLWFVMTCGGEIGNAAKYNESLCNEKHFEYMGTFQILMPENYIAMFNAPDSEQAKKIIKRALPDIQTAGELIKEGKVFPKPRKNVLDRMMSSVINPLFYKMYVKADAFYVKEDCIGCKRCEMICPLNNISFKDSSPEWGKNCTHCMGCICSCPTESIEYGNKSVGKPKYSLQKIIG